MAAQFRIGGVYRNRKGQVAVLRQGLGDGGEFTVNSIPIDGPRWDGDQGYGRHRLSDGWTNVAEAYWHAYNLLPGELHNVNGQWVPVAEEAPKTANLETKVSYDRTTGRTIYEPVYRPLEVPPFSVRVGATEKKRPPLTWATPKPVDRWDGFTVRYDTGAQLADGNNHPLQRMTDPSDPLHGSAWLKVR